MRYSVIKSLNDDFTLNLGSDVEIIVAVINIGSAVDYLIYKTKMNGLELIEFMKSLKLDKCYDLSEIKADFTYEITSYDW